MYPKDKKIIDNAFKSEFLFESTWKILRAFKIFFIALIFSTFFQFLFIPSNSMSPTLIEGDLVLVKLGNNNLKRGDIISFENPLDKKEIYIKRIIGIPKDKIEVIDCKVYVNSVPIEEDYVSLKPVFCKEESLILDDDNYYVLGDNRWDSIDSSYFGPIKEETIKGKIVKIFTINKYYTVLTKK